MNRAPAWAIFSAALMACAVGAAPDEEPAPQRMKALGFVLYRHYWVLPQRRDSLLRERPALRVRSRLPVPLKVTVDGEAAGRVPEKGATAIPVTEGPHKVRLEAKHRQGRAYPLEVRRGYDAHIEVMMTGDAPSVLPPLPYVARDRSRTVKGDDYRIRVVDNEPRSGTLKKVRTRQGAWILGPRGDEIGFDPETWTLTSGYLYGSNGPALCVSDRLGTYLFNDPRIDKMLFEAAARRLSGERIPTFTDMLVKMGELGESSLAPFVAQSLRHDSPWVRNRAAAALGSIGTAELVEPLKRLALVEKDSGVARQIERSVSRIEARVRAGGLTQEFWTAGERRQMAILDELRKSPQDVPFAFLRRIAEQSKNPAHREVAATLLGEHQIHSAIAPLLNGLKDTEPTVRAFALASLGKLEALEALKPIAKCLGDTDRRVRAAAATTLGDLGAANEVPRLLPRLEDEDKWVRHAAMVALEKISGRRQRVPPEAGEEAAARVVKRWKAWWEGRAEEAPASPGKRPEIEPPARGEEADPAAPKTPPAKKPTPADDLEEKSVKL